MRLLKLAGLCAAGAALVLAGSPSKAASHSDAPLSKQDPQANFTDVYAFVRQRPTGRVLVVVANCRPFSEPGDGVIYDRFADDARYSIHIANPATGATICRYDFRFSSITGGNKNLDTVLSYGLGTEAGPIEHVGDARQNYTQTYTITKVLANGTTTVITKDVNNSPLMVPPPNVGKRTTPYYNDADGFAVSGAPSIAALDRYTKETVYSLAGNMLSFCGSRDDSFYSDIPGIFDLLDPRILDNDGDGLGDGIGQDGDGVDGFKGFNVLTYSIAIPLSDLPQLDYNAVLVGPSKGVGVYASISRPRVTLRRSDGSPISSGPWVQVNRMGNPLFNEGLVALRDKDAFNRTDPTVDSVRFRKYAEKPELAFLINFVIFGDPTGQSPLATTGRADLVAVFIPEVLRVDTTTGATKVAGEAGFNRFSVLGGDTIKNGDGKDIPAGWPNGRRLGDDVVDIALTVLASGPSFSTVTVVGDNVDHNDIPYNIAFPYAATPHSGTRSKKDSGINAGP